MDATENERGGTLKETLLAIKTKLPHSMNEISNLKKMILAQDDLIDPPEESGRAI
jgi:hypothetical protein